MSGSAGEVELPDLPVMYAESESGLDGASRRRGARSIAGLQRDLDTFRYWYNRIRPHQALGIALGNGTARLALTPAEAWHREISGDRGVWFESWNGILRGYACRI